MDHPYRLRRAIAKDLETATAQEEIARRLRGEGSEQAAQRAEAKAKKARVRAARGIESLGLDPRD